MKTVQTRGRSPASAMPTVVSQEGNAKHSSARAIYIVFALMSGALMDASHARVEGLPVPPCIYPVGTGAAQWSTLATVAMPIPTTVILNPNSGPDTTQDINYAATVAKVRATGGKMIGYVSSSYVNRSLSVVVQDINIYQTLYQVDGFFIDEMTADSTATHTQFYQLVYNYIKGLSFNYTVTNNFSTNVPEICVNLPVTDQPVVFESGARYYASYASPVWRASYPMARFTYVVYATSVAQMQTFIRSMSGRGAATAFTTNKTLPNPYGALPIHWSREVSIMAAVL